LAGERPVFVKPFAYLRAQEVAEASRLLADGDGSVKALAGGQSLLPMINAGLVECSALVDISSIAGLRGISQASDGSFLELGALETHRSLAADPSLKAGQPLVAEAARHIGNTRVRNRGTLGGSLAHADPSGELPLVMTALGATVVVENAQRKRELRAEELQASYFSTVLEDDELITAVRVPAISPGWGWGFVEASRRRGDFAMVAVASLMRTASGEVVEARLAVGGVAERPVRLAAVEAALSGAGREDLVSRATHIGGLEPMSDANATSRYRRHLLPVLVARALAQAYDRAESGLRQGGHP
jgi:carbon-monoxide dehydrogenase medium subunit